MKLRNLFITFFTLFVLFHLTVFADEIVQSDGTTIPCKIETVLEGLIEYRQNGSLYSFSRISQSPIFSDYVTVKNKLFKKDSITKYIGRIIIKNNWSTTILTYDEKYIEIPFFRVKYISIYRP